ncbi:28S ribosomal protein S27, mitochondrial [Zerene cesonia]|uniref:28S ribosomal protein S27, mitochondrial n=1 Tax=Zerene cesonia TaxID=33412 RepID=UPI0018E4E3FF|nr:28S ribosomal protein S27, mitochondrial [Zerene cesonia]
MFRTLRYNFVPKYSAIIISKQSFLTNEYKCINAWSKQTTSPILTKVNLNDFYTSLEQHYSSKGVVSAIDVDIFANAVKDPLYLDELKDLLHKLRLSAETGNTLESTHHATVRNYLEFGNINELVEILKDPLNYGIFLDFYAANLLMDKLITSQNYELAANVASLIMLQEDYSNDITCTLCQYACYKFISAYKPPLEENKNEKENNKVEEIKIRVKYLRNGYFDDHFDIKDIKLLTGKTLAWISKQFQDNTSNNLQLLGLLYYKKFDKLLLLCDKLTGNTSFKVYKEVLNLMEAELTEESKESLGKCISLLNNAKMIEEKMEESIKIMVENAINRSQTKDIAAQEQMFKNWEIIRETRLQEQTKRLDRIRRIQSIEEKQKELEKEEQKLWFFENEEKIDLQIEEKEQLEDKRQVKSKVHDKSDEDYIPPEILPQKK